MLAQMSRATEHTGSRVTHYARPKGAKIGNADLYIEGEQIWLEGEDLKIAALD